MGQSTPPPAGDLICVCVRLQPDGADRFYVLRWPELQRVFINGYRGYLERHGGRRPKRIDSFHTALRETHIEPFLDNWSLFDVFTEISKTDPGTPGGPSAPPQPPPVPAATGRVPQQRRAGGFSRTRWLDPRLGRETVDPPGHVGIMGAVGHAPRPQAPAASRPSHSRPGGRVPRPCRLVT